MGRNAYMWHDKPANDFDDNKGIGSNWNPSKFYDPMIGYGPSPKRMPEKKKS